MRKGTGDGARGVTRGVTCLGPEFEVAGRAEAAPGAKACRAAKGRCETGSGYEHGRQVATPRGSLSSVDHFRIPD
jgi:hypothetical protein